MAKVLTALEIKKNVVRIVQLEKKLTQFNLINLKTTSLPFTPSLEYEENVSLIASRIRELIVSSKLNMKNVILILPSRELMVRFFNVAWLNRKERNEAIRYEAQKYIPFSLDEIISDFYIPYEVKERELKVVFSAIKKTTLERYIKIAEELDIKLLAAEPYPFSLMRALFFSGDLKPRNFTIVLDIDYVSSTILVAQGMNLYLARDFSLTEETPISSEEILKRTLSELKRTVDYMIKELPYQQIKEVIICGEACQEDFREKIAEELNINVKIASLKDKVQAQDKEILNKYVGIIGAALRGSVLSDIEVDLFSNYYKKIEGEKAQGILKFIPRQLFSDILIAFVACFGFVFYVGLQKKTIKKIENSVMVPQIYNSQSLDDLKHEISMLKKKKSGLQQLLKKSYLTPILNIIAKYIPEGVWLDKFSFLSNQGKPILILEGISYNQDSNKEMDLVYEFFNKIKDSQEIKNSFNEIKVQNVRKAKIGDYNVVKFTIQGYMK